MLSVRSLQDGCRIRSRASPSQRSRSMNRSCGATIPPSPTLPAEDLVELARWLRSQRDRAQGIVRNRRRIRRGKAEAQGTATETASERGLVRQETGLRARPQTGQQQAASDQRRSPQGQRRTASLHAALARRQATVAHHPSPGWYDQRVQACVRKQSSRRRTNVPPGRIGSVSQAGKAFQAARDQARRLKTGPVLLINVTSPNPRAGPQEATTCMKWNFFTAHQPRIASATAAYPRTRRLDLLRSFPLLDARREAPFDRIVYTAAQIFRTPIALISFVDAADRQWFKASVGLAQPDLRTKRSPSAIRPSCPTPVFTIEDATLSTPASSTTRWSPPNPSSGSTPASPVDRRRRQPHRRPLRAGHPPPHPHPLPRPATAGCSAAASIESAGRPRHDV